MPSIRLIRKSLVPGRTGANPTPQLPMTTVVTPCNDEGASCESHGDVGVPAILARAIDHDSAAYYQVMHDLLLRQ